MDFGARCGVEDVGQARFRRRTPGTPILPENPGNAPPLFFTQHLHHFPRLAVLLDEAVDLLDLGPRAAGDPPPAAGVEGLRLAALLGRHRAEDRLLALHILFGVALLLGSDFYPARSREHIQDLAQRPELAHLADLLEQVLQGALAAEGL